MDFSAARIAGLEAELAALRGGAPVSEGGGVQGPLAAPTPSNALAQALQVPGQGQVADNYLRPDKFVSSCAHFGRHHPRGGNAQRAEPQELSPHDLAQSSAAYQQALATNKNEEARVLLTAISGALYFEVGAIGLADCLRSRDKLVASARATKASVEAAFPEGGDVDDRPCQRSECRAQLSRPSAAGPSGRPRCKSTTSTRPFLRHRQPDTSSATS